MKCWLHTQEKLPVRHNSVVLITGDGSSLILDFGESSVAEQDLKATPQMVEG